MQETNNIHIEKDSLGVGEVATAASNPICKLIDTISSAIGTIYEPTKIRRKADAEAYEIRTLASAKKEAEEMGKSELALNLDRVGKRFVATELRRQENIDYIVGKAMEQIEMKESVSDKPVDPDWTARFVNVAQDVSDEEMRNMWAQILSGEVAQPGSFSLRTLECLKNMSKQDAELFVKFASLVFEYGDILFVFRDEEILKANDIIFFELTWLRDIGLVASGESTVINIKKSDIHMCYFNKITLLKNKKTDLYKMPVYVLTSVGRELYNITIRTFHEAYFMDVLKKMKNHFEIVEYSNILYELDGSIHFSRPTTVVE